MSEKSAIGILAPAKLENPMNQMMWGSAGRKASIQSRKSQRIRSISEGATHSTNDQ